MGPPGRALGSRSELCVSGNGGVGRLAPLLPATEVCHTSGNGSSSADCSEGYSTHAVRYSGVSDDSMGALLVRPPEAPRTSPTHASRGFLIFILGDFDK
jgi:hypothetical protein